MDGAGAAAVGTDRWAQFFDIEGAVADEYNLRKEVPPIIAALHTMRGLNNL